MLPQTLPLTEFKKNYKFLWSIDAASTNSSKPFAGRLSNTMEAVSLQMMKQFTLDNPVYCGYVSQLAETVNLPDDEFEIEQMTNGPVTYEIPKKVKMQNITVVYLEDSINSVYNFHKTWYNMIRGGTGVYFTPPTQLCATARFIEFENTLTATEYMTYFNYIRTTIKSSINESISSNLPSLLNSLRNTLKPEVPIGAKPTGITTYPRIYPTKISRTPANKGGSELSRVTVVYSRIPTFKKNHTNLQKLGPDGTTWEDVTE